MLEKNVKWIIFFAFILFSFSLTIVSAAFDPNLLPGTPYDIKVTPLTYHSVKVEWAANATGGNVEKFLVSGRYDMTWKPTSDTSMIIDNLDENSQACFGVIAYNKYGYSSYLAANWQHPVQPGHSDWTMAKYGCNTTFYTKQVWTGSYASSLSKLFTNPQTGALQTQGGDSSAGWNYFRDLHGLMQQQGSNAANGFDSAIKDNCPYYPLPCSESQTPSQYSNYYDYSYQNHLECHDGQCAGFTDSANDPGPEPPGSTAGDAFIRCGQVNNRDYGALPYWATGYCSPFDTNFNSCKSATLSCWGSTISLTGGPKVIVHDYGSGTAANCPAGDLVISTSSTVNGCASSGVASVTTDYEYKCVNPANSFSQYQKGHEYSSYECPGKKPMCDMATGTCISPCKDEDHDGFDTCNPGEPGDDGSVADALDSGSVQNDFEPGQTCNAPAFDPANPDTSRSAIVAWCNIDSNNNGVKDHAGCAPCINPGTAEKVDNIDNNGAGFCQADPSVSCSILGKQQTDYTGDGADSPQYCSGMKSYDNAELGVYDRFCQMVDEGGGSYTRNVISVTLIKDTKQTEQIPNCIPTDNNQPNECTLEIFNAYSFKPGGITSSIFKGSTNAECGKYIIKKSYDKSSSSFDTFYSANIDDSTSCLPDKENIGKTRNSQGPLQFIDSAFSEFGKTGFDSFVGLLSSAGLSFSTPTCDGGTNAAMICDPSIPVAEACPGQTYHGSQFGPPGYFTPSACVVQQTVAIGNVKKDKCDDGASNTKAKDLFLTYPYHDYFTYMPIYDSSGQEINFKKSFLVNLVDTDNPECKFKDGVGGAGEQSPEPTLTSARYNWPEDYLTRPLTDTTAAPLTKEDGTQVTGEIPYCLDRDGDGFCGEETKLSEGIRYKVISDTDKNNRYMYSYSEGYNSGPASKYATQFPDCDDSDKSPALDQYPYSRLMDLLNAGDPRVYQYIMRDASTFDWLASTADYKRIELSTLYGWTLSPDDPSINYYDAWSVHPFSPVTPQMCKIASYDFNCNKDGKAGYDYASLFAGKTPFDFNIATGVEKPTSTDAGDFACRNDLSAKRVFNIINAVGLGLDNTKSLPSGAILSTNSVYMGDLNVNAGSQSAEWNVGAVLVRSGESSNYGSLSDLVITKQKKISPDDIPGPLCYTPTICALDTSKLVDNAGDITPVIVVI